MSKDKPKPPPPPTPPPTRLVKDGVPTKDRIPSNPPQNKSNGK